MGHVSVHAAWHLTVAGVDALVVPEHMIAEKRMDSGSES